MNRNIPNALTLFRILLIPVFAWYLFFTSFDCSIWMALLVFIIASLTDYWDGFLARKYNIISNFGKIMDPLADKLLVLTALGGLTWLQPYRLSPFIFWLILGRELLITILREIYKNRGIIVAADKLGKLKTVTQMLGIIAAYLLWAWGKAGNTAVMLISFWFWLVTLLTLVSGANYLKPRRGLPPGSITDDPHATKKGVNP